MRLMWHARIPDKTAKRTEKKKKIADSILSIDSAIRKERKNRTKYAFKWSDKCCANAYAPKRGGAIGGEG